MSAELYLSIGAPSVTGGRRFFLLHAGGFRPIALLRETVR